VELVGERAVDGQARQRLRRLVVEEDGRGGALGNDLADLLQEASFSPRRCSAWSEVPSRER
jgi:hypothetical protein